MLNLILNHTSILISVYSGLIEHTHTSNMSVL